MNEMEIIHATTFYSLGIERLLKFILADINPIFVLSDGDFKNAAPVLYASRIVNTDPDKILASKPIDTVISFRVAMQRASIFSTGVKSNTQMLYSLAGYRDILAHRPLSQLDLINAQRLLAKDGYKLVNDICVEKGIKTTEFFGEYDKALNQLGIHLQNQDNFAIEMQQRLETFNKLWLSRKDNQIFIDQAAELNSIILGSTGGDTGFDYEPFTCPACGQPAVAKVVPDYEYDHELNYGYVSGVFVDYIKCFYCTLKLSEYDELNYVHANSILEGKTK